MSIVFFAWGDVVEHGGHDHDRASGPSFARTTGEVEVAAPGKSGSGKSAPERRLRESRDPYR